MEDKILNEKESLNLISQMITNTQNRLIANQGYPFLIWGYGISVTSLVIWTLILCTGNMAWNFLWFLPTAVCYPLMFSFTKHQNNAQGVRTFVDKIVNYIWIFFGVSEVLVTIAMYIMGFVYGKSIPIFYITMVLLGFAISLTGLVIKFRPVFWAGIFSFILSFGFLFTEIPASTSYHLIYPLFALSMILIMVIPGHILNAKARRQCSNR